MANDDLDELEQPKKSPVMLIAIVGAVVVVGGGAAFFLLSGGDEATAETSGGDGDETSSGDMPGPIVELQPFVVNLIDTERARYLKVGVSLELRDEAAKVRYDARKIQARHVVLMTLSSLAYEETHDVDDRNRLRQRLHGQLEEVVGARNVKAVFFTDFVTQ
jgi:flagellar FliL protein